MHVIICSRASSLPRPHPPLNTHGCVWVCADLHIPGQDGRREESVRNQSDEEEMKEKVRKSKDGRIVSRGLRLAGLKNHSHIYWTVFE